MCSTEPIRFYWDLTTELALVGEACSTSQYGRLLLGCSASELSEYSRAAIEVETDLIAYTNELLDGMRTINLGDITKAQEPNPSAYPYVRFFLQVPWNRFLLSSNFGIWAGVGRLAKYKVCGWFPWPRPDHAADWVQHDSSNPRATLQNCGYHETDDFAAGYPTNLEDWTRPKTHNWWLCNWDSYRDHALIPLDSNQNHQGYLREQNYASQDIDPAEPNPEIFDYIWPYEEWPFYARWWHRNCNPQCP